MIHDLTLEQKIEVASEQIENSLELGLSSEKRQIRLILTQFAQEVVSGNNTGDSGLHLQRVRRSFSKKDMEICWNNARSKRFDTGVTIHNNFDSWYRNYLKKTK